MSSIETRSNIIIVNSHPIQYFAPLYEKIAKDETIDLEVWYCSKHGLEGEIDRQFGTSVKWDIPLLNGYKYQFLKNNSWKPSIYTGFWGLCNLQVIKLLWKAPKSLIIVHGWNYATNLITIIAAKIFGHTTGLRGEAPITLEMERSCLGIKKRRIAFSLLFPWIDYFLYVGINNLKFYQYYGVSVKHLIFTPYSVDNDRLSSSYHAFLPNRDKLKIEKGLLPDVHYALYSGKYIKKKRPMDLLKAIHALQSEGVNAGAIFMGDGELRPEMEEYIRSNQLKNVLLTGFINQSEIPLYYTIADSFVMCSDTGETWGLSTNEAMNFELPVVIYDSVGCSLNLVKNGQNGYVIERFNVAHLKDVIKSFANDKNKCREYGKRSREIIAEYSYSGIVDGMKKVG